MTRDLLLDLARSPLARRLSKSLKLPLTLPQPLAREEGPWRASPLEGVRVVVLGASDAPLRGLLAELAAKAGAAVGETVPGQLGALVYDATGLAAIADLAQLYEAVKSRLGRLAPCSRIVVVGHDPRRAPPERAAASQALVGFVKSVGKELGRRGTTAQLLLVDDESAVAARLAGPLRFLLSRSSAFVSGQVLALSALAAAPADEPWPRPLQGKAALVTGAARGIGAAIAEKLAEEGARVALLDRPGEEPALAALAARVGGPTLAIDLADPAAAAVALERWLRSGLGGLDLLVNNAGVTRDRTLGRLSRESWDQVLNVNLQAVVAISERLHESGLLRDQGRVVCISSIAGIAGNAGQTNYAASKAGVIGFVRAFAPALARRGATINAVAPGVIETRMTAAMPAVIREVGRRLSALNQGGTPRDVAEAVAFLCTPGAVGLTGQTLRVCGLSFIGA